MGHESRTKLLALEEYVAVDTETTGLDTRWCEIIEIAAVKVVSGVVSDVFQELVKPDDYPIPEFITKLTGITNEMLEDARSIQDVIVDYIEFAGGDPVVGQNVSFDLRFLEHAVDQAGLPAYHPSACDIMRLSRMYYPELEHHRLKDTVERCGKDADMPSFGKAHRAQADAEMTAWCYEVLKTKLTAQYGDDPETAYRRQKLHESYESYKTYFDGLAPTVEFIDEGNPFFGTGVCFTGKLSCMTRKQAWQYAVNLGAVPQKSVTKKTDFLVVGSMDFSANIRGDKTSKLRRAEELFAANGSPEIVSEDFFLQFVDAG